VHEVRTWIVACSALGTYDVVESFYQPVPEWIVAFGLLVAEAR
jgi:2,3-dihydroxyphenylpropionate 1,2-dioxygenase